MWVCSCNGGINCCSFKQALADADVQETLRDKGLKNLSKLSTVYGRASQYAAEKRHEALTEPKDFNCNSCRATVAQMVRESGMPLTVRELERQLEHISPQTENA